MAEEGLQALEAELRSSPPRGLASLDDEKLRELAGAVADVRRRQAKALQAAGDQALRHIPRLLRGPVRKIAG